MSMTSYELESYSRFDRIVIAEIELNLHLMVNQDIYVGDLECVLNEYQEAGEYPILGPSACMDFISTNRLVATEIFDTLVDKLDCHERLNPFGDPEMFVGLMFMQRACELIPAIPWKIDNCGKTVRLTTDMVSDIVTELLIQTLPVED